MKQYFTSVYMQDFFMNKYYFESHFTNVSMDSGRINSPFLKIRDLKFFMLWKAYNP